MPQHIILSLGGQWRYEITSKLFVCSPALSDMPFSIMGSEVILSLGCTISMFSCNLSGSLMDFCERVAGCLESTLTITVTNEMETSELLRFLLF